MGTPLSSCWSLAGVLLVLSTSLVQAQDHGKHGRHKGIHAQSHSGGPVRMTMEELHQHGGVPPGWKFGMPVGDPKAGRQAFLALECYKCHHIATEKAPEFQPQADHIGPDLTGMGMHHPAEYFAESILNPNAVIVIGEGFSGPNGLSRMPEYNDTLTIKQLIDLVAYLKSLRGAAAATGAGDRQHGSHHPGHGSHQHDNGPTSKTHKNH